MVILSLPGYITDWLYKNAFKYPNVIGFSNDFSIAQVDGGFFPSIDNVVRFYVREKMDENLLSRKQIIPTHINLRHHLKKYRFETDIIQLGDVQANPPIPFDLSVSDIDKTVNFRPVELGVSVGNEAITAGSLGMLYIVLEGNEDYYVKTGDILAGSNAHVLTPDATWSVEDVYDSLKLNILQRGAYHGGKTPEDVVGSYIWHKPINGLNPDSDCPVSGGTIKLLNSVSKLLNRESRFRAFVPGFNTIDFSLYQPTVEHILNIADGSINIRNSFGGHLFAGSDQSGILVHVSEIIKQSPIKIKPLNGNYSDFKVGDRVRGCSFWCNYETNVIDTNATLNVGYGNTIAPFEHTVVVTNNGTIKGGWSGSGFFRV